MRRCLVMLVLWTLATSGLSAGELAGVTLPDSIMVNGEALKLNGTGLRKKLWVEVYVAGLYLASPTGDPADVVNADGSKKVVMHFLTDRATKKKMDAAWIEGFKANSPTEFETLQDRVQEFIGWFGDLKVGDVIELTMVPSEGTTAVFNGSEVGVVEGDDFAAALLRVWMGDHPPTADLKAGMLGN